MEWRAYSSLARCVNTQLSVYDTTTATAATIAVSIRCPVTRG
jgi:hypothetical protein